MARKKPQDTPAGERWAVPYADFLSLLLALFIALWAISSTETSRAKSYTQAIINFFANPHSLRVFQPIFQQLSSSGEVQDSIDDGTKPHTSDGDATSISAKDKENISQVQMLTQEGGVLEQVEQGVVLRLPVGLIFESGKANLSSEEMLTYVRRIAEIITQKLPAEVKIDVRGYTDNTPLPKDSGFGDHYGLAAARAYTVMRNLINNGIKPENISFSSYGQHSPIAPNTTNENRAKNNRVEIYLLTAPRTVKNIKSILDENIKEGETIILDASQ